MDSSFDQITCDILASPIFQETRDFLHHGSENSVYDHSVATARAAFSLAQRFGLNDAEIRSVTRAALLHDFFGYDWHSDWFSDYVNQFSGWQRFRHMHAFVHGNIAAARAHAHFGLTARQHNAIASHMFPLAPSLPRSREAWILTLADKIVASREVTQAAGYYAAALCRRWFPVVQQ